MISTARKAGFWWGPIVVLAFIILLITSCGDDDDDGGGTYNPSTGTYAQPGDTWWFSTSDNGHNFHCLAYYEYTDGGPAIWCYEVVTP